MDKAKNRDPNKTGSYEGKHQAPSSSVRALAAYKSLAKAQRQHTKAELRKKPISEELINLRKVYHRVAEDMLGALARCERDHQTLRSVAKDLQPVVKKYCKNP